MSDTFLPGSGFDTYEQQDKVLVGLCGGTGCKAAVRILQQQGFAVMGAVVRLCTDDPVVDAAKEAAKALGIECITLNASELASQLAEETAAPADLRFPALLAAAGHPVHCHRPPRSGRDRCGRRARPLPCRNCGRECPACRPAAGNAGPAHPAPGRFQPRGCG